MYRFKYFISTDTFLKQEDIDNIKNYYKDSLIVTVVKVELLKEFIYCACPAYIFEFICEGFLMDEAVTYFLGDLEVTHTQIEFWKKESMGYDLMPYCIFRTFDFEDFDDEVLVKPAR